MASEPTVCCIMLTKDRPELAARAVRCFSRQTYRSKRLLICDAGGDVYAEYGGSRYRGYYRPGMTIGAARNEAVMLTEEWLPKADVIVHFDDDDVSHPNRIAEQVAFLQSSGAAVVGYNQMLFWRDIDPAGPNWRKRVMSGLMVDFTSHAGESWLYTGPAHQPLGTSLCYWRKTWEQHRFDDRKHAGEDSDFLARVGHRSVKSVTSICSCKEHVSVSPMPYKTLVNRLNAANATDLSPRMIATVHGANTQQATYDGFFKGGTLEMRRVSEWDEKVRATLEGA